MTVVLGIGVLYGILIMTTFQRYGTVMDKAWKHRIDEWIEEKATGNIDSYAQPVLDDRPYSPPRWYSPDHSARYQRPRPRDNPSRYYQSSFDEVNGRYPRNTSRYSPVYVPPLSRTSSPSSKSYTDALPYAPPTIVPLPGSPHSAPSSKSDDAPTINRPGPNQSAPQPDPKRPVTTAEEYLPSVIPERTLYPILESSITPSEDEDNALGFSSGLENRSGGGDDAPDDGNRVRFRLPSGSSDSYNQGIPGPRKTQPRKPPKN